MHLGSFLFCYHFLPGKICTRKVYIREAELFTLHMEWAIEHKLIHYICPMKTFPLVLLPIAVTTEGGSSKVCKCLLEFNSNTSYRIAE